MSKFLPNLPDNIKVVGTDSIHLVNKCNTRNAIFVGLSPYGLRLRFHTANGAKDTNRTIKNP